MLFIYNILHAKYGVCMPYFAPKYSKMRIYKKKFIYAMIL